MYLNNNTVNLKIVNNNFVWHSDNAHPQLRFPAVN
jgi:hypothetical protein